MRVCPKCGHHDPWYWRGSGIYPGLEYCRFSEFEKDYPEISQALLKAQQEHKTKNLVLDEDYGYHLTKGMNVERQSLIENPSLKWTSKEAARYWRIPVEATQTKKKSAYGFNPAFHGKKVQIYNPHPKQKKLVE